MFRHTVCCIVFCIVSSLATLAPTPVVCAQEKPDPSFPLAIRRLPGGLEVESFWGPTVVFKPETQSEQVGVISFGNQYDHWYYRKPNEEKTQWIEAKTDAPSIQNGAHVWSIGEAGVAIEMDDCRILILNDSVTLAQTQANDRWDLVVFFIDKNAKVESVSRVAQQVSSRNLLILPSSELAGEQWQAKLSQFEKELAAHRDHVEVPHRVMAISGSKEDENESVVKRWITLGENEWEMPEDLSQAFEAMETACRKSQQVFAKLSVEQMNFRPSNGTHTPRWNAEHMKGRQLLFFSQIYHQIDPTIGIYNLNPKQNPEDYVAAHSDWNGAEEAKQMQRVSRFTRTFAYLLDGIDLDRRAPGSRWPSMNALLKQMDRHYSEHTENTEKKFQLADWPKGSDESSSDR